MFTIPFGDYPFKVRVESGQRQIFDVVRKKYVAATPEELVRQHVLHHLITDKHYPPSLLAIEYPLKLYETSKRCDIVVFNQQHRPAMIVECKAPTVKLTDKAFRQAARYNLKLQVPFLLIGNGEAFECGVVNHQKQETRLLGRVPEYDELLP